MLPLGAALLVVVVVTPEPTPEHAKALESACSEALGGTCSLRSEPDGESAEAVAIVSLDETTPRAIIQLGRRKQGQRDWSRRTLEFAPEDDEVERLKAIGLTIATMADEEKQAPAEAPRTEKPPKPPETSPRETEPPSVSGEVGPSDPESAPWLTVSPSLTAGPGLDRGPWRVGGSVRSSIRPFATPVEPTLGASYERLAKRYRGLTASWTRFTAGLAVGREFVSLNARVALSFEGVFEGVYARQRSPADEGSRWLPGVMIGADLVWPWSTMLGVYTHADLVALQGGTALTRGGERLASSPGNSYGVGIGVQIRVR